MQNLPPNLCGAVDKLAVRSTNRERPDRARPRAALYAAMSFKPDEYLHYFEGYDLTSEEKTEFIETLWLIAQSFADQGLGIGSAANDNSPETRAAAPGLVSLSEDKPICTDAANDNGDPETKKGAA